MDETTLTDDDVTTEYRSERGAWIAAESDTDATDATDADADTDADTDADQDADADDADA